MKSLQNFKWGRCYLPRNIIPLQWTVRMQLLVAKSTARMSSLYLPDLPEIDGPDVFPTYNIASTGSYHRSLQFRRLVNRNSANDQYFVWRITRGPLLEAMTTKVSVMNTDKTHRELSCTPQYKYNVIMCRFSPPTLFFACSAPIPPLSLSLSKSHNLISLYYYYLLTLNFHPPFKILVSNRSI